MTSGLAEKQPRFLGPEKLLIAKDSLLILRIHHLHPVFTLPYDSPKTSCSYLFFSLLSVKSKALFLFSETVLINKHSTYCISLNKIISLIAQYIFISHNPASGTFWYKSIRIQNMDFLGGGVRGKRRRKRTEEVVK